MTDLPTPPSADSSVPSDHSGASSPGSCAIIVSRYNDSITSVMLDGAIHAYHEAHGQSKQLAVLEAPGAYELIAVANAAARSGLYASVVCLGCVIKGETTHDAHIASAVAHGLGEITIHTGVPVAFGVLTTNTIEQAMARAGGDVGNKGAEAMNAVLGAAGAIAAIDSAKALKTPGIRYAPGFDVPDKAARVGKGV